MNRAAGEVLRLSKPLTGRGGAPALGLRAGDVAVAILSQTASARESLLMWPTFWLNHLRGVVSRDRAGQSRRPAAHRRRTTTPLLLEVLEDRTVPSFLAPIASYPTGSIPQAVLAADFTGDSLADLAVVNYGDNSVSVLKNLGSGSFDTALTSATGTGPRPFAA